VVAGGEHPATVLPEPHDRVDVGGAEAVTHVDGHQPQLVVVEFVEPAEDRVVAAPICPVAGGDFVTRCPQLVGEQRKAGDLPVVGVSLDRRLQQYL
jgi:hypothetical protein